MDDGVDGGGGGGDDGDDDDDSDDEVVVDDDDDYDDSDMAIVRSQSAREEMALAIKMPSKARTVVGRGGGRKNACYVTADLSYDH